MELPNEIQNSIKDTIKFNFPDTSCDGIITDLIVSLRYTVNKIYFDSDFPTTYPEIFNNYAKTIYKNYTIYKCALNLKKITKFKTISGESEDATYENIPDFYWNYIYE
jgi:hypothetical protein